MNSIECEKLADAICICGTGRSGTSVFYNVLGTHPHLAWVSNLVERFPKYPVLSLFSRFYPIRARFRFRSAAVRFIPRPAESLNTLRFCSNGLFQVPRELDQSDIPEPTISAVRDYYSSIVAWQNKSRLTLKHTGFPRFQFWKSILPNPRFIHIIRDGRAVVHSLMRVSWWDGTMKTWWWGPMPVAYQEEYEKYDRSPIVLAAIVWKVLLDTYEAEAKKLSDNCLFNIRYDAFVKSPTQEMRKVAAFCDLPFTRHFEKRIERYPIRNADLAWQKELSQSDLTILERVMGGHLSKYSFN